MTPAEQGVITGALSDLALGIMIIPMIITLLFIKTERTRQKRWWICFFISLAASSFLGFTVHYFFAPDSTGAKLIWVVLFPALYEVICCFTLTAFSVYCGEQRPRKKDVLLVHGISFAAYTITEIIVHTVGADDIRLLTIYNVFPALFGFFLILKAAFKKGRIGERLLFAALLPVLPGAYTQISRNNIIKIIVYFDHNGITHLCIILAIIILFISTVICLKEKRID